MYSFNFSFIYVYLSISIYIHSYSFICTQRDMCTHTHTYTYIKIYVKVIMPFEASKSREVFQGVFQCSSTPIGDGLQYVHHMASPHSHWKIYAFRERKPRKNMWTLRITFCNSDGTTQGIPVCCQMLWICLQEPGLKSDSRGRHIWNILQPAQIRRNSTSSMCF